MKKIYSICMFLLSLLLCNNTFTMENKINIKKKKDKTNILSNIINEEEDQKLTHMINSFKKRIQKRKKENGEKTELTLSDLEMKRIIKKELAQKKLNIDNASEQDTNTIFERLGMKEDILSKIATKKKKEKKEEEESKFIDIHSPNDYIEHFGQPQNIYNPYPIVDNSMPTNNDLNALHEILLTNNTVSLCNLLNSGYTKKQIAQMIHNIGGAKNIVSLKLVEDLLKLRPNFNDKIPRYIIDENEPQNKPHPQVITPKIPQNNIPKINNNMPIPQTPITPINTNINENDDHENNNSEDSTLANIFSFMKTPYFRVFLGTVILSAMIKIFLLNQN